MNKRVFIIMSFVISMSILIMVWIFVLNRGEIIIYGEPPYSVSITGQLSFRCDQSPCIYSLKPGKYEASFIKAGFFSKNYVVDIPRWGKASYDISFRFIPVLKEIEGYERPANLLSDKYFVDGTEYIYITKELTELKDSRYNTSISKLYNITNAKLAGYKNNIYLSSNLGTYIIDIDTGKKTKINSTGFDSISFSSSKAIIGDQNKYFIYDMNRAEKISVDPEITFIDFYSDTEIVYHTNTGFFVKNIDTDIKEKIFELNWPISEIKKINDSIFFIKDKRYYELQLKNKHS